MTARPVGTPPVNETMSTPRWATSASPKLGPGPLTAFTTPGGQRLGQRRGHGQDGAGAGGRGLHHHRVPGEQGRQELVAEDRDRPVEGQDGGHHAVGDVLDRRPAPAAAGQRPRLEGLGRQRGEGAGHAPDGAGVELRLPQHLAVLAGEQPGQVRRRHHRAGGGGRLAHQLGPLGSCDSAAQAGAARRAAATARSTWAVDAEGPSRTTSAGRTGLVTGYVPASPATTSPSMTSPMVSPTASLPRSSPSPPGVRLRPENAVLRDDSFPSRWQQERGGARTLAVPVSGGRTAGPAADRGRRPGRGGPGPHVGDRSPGVHRHPGGGGGRDLAQELLPLLRVEGRTAGGAVRGRRPARGRGAGGGRRPLRRARRSRPLCGGGALRVHHRRRPAPLRRRPRARAPAAGRVAPDELRAVLRALRRDLPAGVGATPGAAARCGWTTPGGRPGRCSISSSPISTRSSATRSRSPPPTWPTTCGPSAPPPCAHELARP